MRGLVAFVPILLVFENNRGILTYKEHSKSVFVDFDVLEING